MARKVSIKEVATAAGVSTATVSNVFSGKKPVNPDLAEKVRKTADQLGYTVNKAASLLRSGKNSIICMLVPDLADPFFTSIITEIEHLARSDGYEVIVGNSDDNKEIEAGRLNALLEWEPAGAILIPCTDEIPQKLRIKDHPPCVLLDRIADFNVVDTVTVNNFGAGEMAGLHLGSVGHRNVLIAASDMGLSPIRKRAIGAQAGVRVHGGSVRVVELGSDPEAGSTRLAEWFEANHAPSAIIATNDMTTLAVLRFLADWKINLPEEMSVVGFDDYAWMSARRTKITAIRQPVEQIATAAWRQLISRINGTEGAVINTVLECQLIERDSVKRLMKQARYWGDNELGGDMGDWNVDSIRSR